MHPARYIRPIPGPLAALALVLVALAAVAGCTLVGDNLTGLSLSGVEPSPCIKACVESLDERLNAEIARHQSEIETCMGVPEAERGACITAENARFAAAMAEISDSRMECMNDCHRQGTASAG